MPEVALLLLASVGCGGSGVKPSAPGADTDPATGILFGDVTAESGVEFTYRNGQEADRYSILESLGGGVALIDYDGDGLLDVFVTGGGYFAGPDKKEIRGHPCRLYKNLGGWRFRDVTAEVGLSGIEFYTHGAAVADFNRDGWPDLLVTGYGGVALFRNDPTDPAAPEKGRKFTDVTRQAGLAGRTTWATSAAWGDLDGDGFPDLYVCQYVNWSWSNDPVCSRPGKDGARDVCPPRAFEALPHALFRNNGDGTFTDVSKEAGLHAPRREADYSELSYLGTDARERLRQSDREKGFGKGLGVVLADIDGDGKPDVYVANDTTDKFLYLNRGGPGRIRFEDVATPLGVARDEDGRLNGSMGVDVADYDGSGRPSLLVTNFQDEFHALYRNVSAAGRLAFRSDSRGSGLAGLSRHFVGFGTGFLDADNDGWQDIVIVNGHVYRNPPGSTVRQRPVLLRGGAGQRNAVRFADATARAGPYFREVHAARGLAVGDLDNDGRPDLVVSHVNEPLTLLRNESDSGHHWLGIVLEGKGHRDVVGAKVTLEVGGRTLTQFAKGGGSYLSSGDRRLLFGLGTANRPGRLTVSWPRGTTQTRDGLAADHYWLLSEAESRARQLYR
jgi:hypothetical protein